MTDRDRPESAADARATGAAERSVILGGGGTGQKGIYIDAQQIPTSLSQPTMQAGQPAPPATAAEPPSQPPSNPE
jgi:hypothetical protein